MIAKREEFTREQLYALVWSQPMVKLSERFRMSDVALKKICKKHNIPTPPRGYWQRVETGRKIKQANLPKVVDARSIIIKVKPEPKPVLGDDMADDVKEKAEAEKSGPKIIVAEDIALPHKVTRATKRALKARSPDDYGAIKCLDEEAFYLRIAPDSTERVLRFIDALMKECDARGYTLQPGKPRKTESYKDIDSAKLVVNGEVFGFSIEETIRRRPHIPTPEEIAKREKSSRSRSWSSYSSSFYSIPRYDFIPSGKLKFSIAPGRYGSSAWTWSDKKSQLIEDCLNEIQAAFIVMAANMRDERIRAEERERRRQAEDARRAEMRRQVEAERKAVSELEAQAEAWRRAELIRGYADAVEARGGKGADASLSEEQTKWLAWARDYADRIDPLTGSKPSILDLKEEELCPLSYWSYRQDR